MYYSPYGPPFYPPPFPPTTTPPRTRNEIKEMLKNWKAWQAFVDGEEKKKKDKEREKMKPRTFSFLEVFAILCVVGPFVSVGYAYVILNVMRNIGGILAIK